MTSPEGFDHRSAHDEEELREAALDQLGRELAELLPDDEEWEKLNERAKALWLRKAHQLMQERMGIRHATRIRVIHRGYEEETGDIVIPSPALDESPRVLAALLCHELEHAWQLDVMLGRTEPPRRELDRSKFEAAYADYDPTNKFKYMNNALERDADDRVAELMKGFDDVRARAEHSAGAEQQRGDAGDRGELEPEQ